MSRAALETGLEEESEAGGAAGHMMLLGALKLFSPENCAAEENDSFFLVQKNKRLSGHQMFRAEQTFY